MFSMIINIRNDSWLLACTVPVRPVVVVFLRYLKKIYSWFGVVVGGYQILTNYWYLELKTEIKKKQNPGMIAAVAFL